MTIGLKTDQAAVLATIIKLSGSNIQYESKISSFLNILAWELGIDHAVLLTLDRVKRQLTPLWQADFSGSIFTPVPLEGNMIGRCLMTRQTFLAESSDIDLLPREWAVFVEPYSQGIMVTPLADDRTTYGVLLLLSRQFHGTSQAKSIIMEAVTNALALTIKNYQLAVDTRKRLSVQNVLSDLGRTLSSTIDVEKIMDMIPRIAAGIFLADGCTLNILDEGGQRLIMSSHDGLVPPAYNFERYSEARMMPESVAIALSRTTSFSGYLKDDHETRELSETEMYNTILSCPLSFQGHHLGSISLFNKLGGRSTMSIAPQLFDYDDLELLLSMNNMISGVLENAITFKELEVLAQRNESMVAYLSTLYDISSAMMTTVRYDELVWIIIRALTDRQGLGFDHVLFLLLDDEAKCGTALRSSAAWTYGNEADMPQAGDTLSDVLKNPSLDEAAQMLSRGQDMDITIPVHQGSNSILAQVVLTKTPMLGFRIGGNENEYELKDFGSKDYAAVPLVAKNQDVGVIVVDRSISGKPLSNSNLRDLSMLANQAGLAIENARLYDDLEQANQTLSQVRGQLIEVEKIAAKGEMGAHLAHEVRNPLVSIGGFTRRLLKKMEDGDPLKKYAEIIWEEVERVNKVLNNILDFSRDEKGRVRYFKLEDLVAETLHSLRHELKRQRVKVETKLEPPLSEISADDHQVMHIILNLIYNATQAMAPKGGRIYIRVHEAQVGDLVYVACEVTDTGPGIPEDVLPNLFETFFTTRTGGTGLGLTIAKKIVDRYHGMFQVTNHPSHIPGSGACFTFMFPAAQAGTIRP